jgi:hypothetical protein
MMKTAATAAAIILLGVAIGFSGLLGGEESVSTEAAADAAFAAATTSHASAAATASSLRAPANGPTPEICARIMTQLLNRTIGDPDARNPAPHVAAANKASSLAAERQLLAAGCTSEYIDTNSDAIMELVNRGRPPEQHVR